MFEFLANITSGDISLMFLFGYALYYSVQWVAIRVGWMSYQIDRFVSSVEMIADNSSNISCNLDRLSQVANKFTTVTENNNWTSNLLELIKLYLPFITQLYCPKPLPSIIPSLFDSKPCPTQSLSNVGLMGRIGPLGETGPSRATGLSGATGPSGATGLTDATGPCTIGPSTCPIKLDTKDESKCPVIAACCKETSCLDASKCPVIEAHPNISKCPVIGVCGKECPCLDVSKCPVVTTHPNVMACPVVATCSNDDGSEFNISKTECQNV